MPNMLNSFFSRFLFIQDLRFLSFFYSNKNSLNWKGQNQFNGKHVVISAPHTNMTKPIINYDQVLALSNQNMELAKKLLMAFLYELEPVASTFRPNPSDEDMEAISKLTHKIKPSLQLLEIESLNQKMNIYKMKYREGTIGARKELPGLYEEIMELYKKIQEEIQNYISNKDQ
jgi:hypothetical protein